MHVVAICNFNEGTAESVQALANALGITVDEARLRVFGNRPAVVASFAEQTPALELAGKLKQSGIATLVFDAAALKSNTGYFIVRRFVLKERSIAIEAGDGRMAEILFDEVELLLPCTSIVEVYGQKAVIERKLSIGKTILSGGIPMTTKVERLEGVKSEERGKVLYLYSAKLPPVVFSQAGMTFDGLGPAMKLSRELNFTYLTGELRRLCTKAVYDDLLLNRTGQTRLLGPGLNPETNLNIAVEVLARCLRLRGREAY